MLPEGQKQYAGGSSSYRGMSGYGGNTQIHMLVAIAGHMAGLGLFGQKNVIAATTPIATAFKFCIRHRKNGLLNRLPIEVRFWCF